MPARQCHHCKQWIEKGEAHDCWTTTEAALTEDLFDDLRDAWERLRETTAGFGDQRIYASHKSIMFSRAALPDPAHLLQGTGKFMRHVKLQPGTPTNAAALTRLIDAAYSDIKARVEHG